MSHPRLAAVALALATLVLLSSQVAAVSANAPAEAPLRQVAGPAASSPAASGCVVTGGEGGLLDVLPGYDDDGLFSSSCDFNPALWENPAQDRIYFDITDDARDNSANVTITDTNASRDGLPNPVLSLTVPLTTGFAGSEYDSVSATPPVSALIPTDLPLGGTWKLAVNVGGPLDLNETVAFQVQTFEVGVSSDSGYHVPGDTVHAYYDAISYASAGPLGGDFSVAASGCYTNATSATCGEDLDLSSLSLAGAIGNFSFALPTTARVGTTVRIDVWVNLTVQSTTESEEGIGTFLVEGFASPDLCPSLSSAGGNAWPTICPNDVYDFIQGSQVVINITSLQGPSAASPEAIFPQATLALQLTDNGQTVAPPSGFATSLGTGVTGSVRDVLNTANLPLGTIEISVRVNDPANDQETAFGTLNISLASASSGIVLQVSLGSSQYYGGDVITGTYQLVNTTANGPVPAGWHVYALLAEGYADDGACTGTATEVLGAWNVTSSGDFGNLPGVPIPSGFAGSVAILAYAHNGTPTVSGGIAAGACALVSQPTLLVNPSEVSYLPGDSINVGLTPEGTAFEGATYAATVSGTPSGSSVADVIFSSPNVGTSFGFTIPKAGTLAHYTLSVTASNDDGVVGGSDVTLTEESFYTVSVSVGTVSQYADGSYQPGEGITLDYSINPLGTAVLPATVVLWVTVGNEPSVREAQGSTSGSFPVTIPSNAGNGLLAISVQATVVTGTGTYTPTGLTGVIVEQNPSVLAYDLGAGSGFTVGMLLLVIVIAVLALLAFFLWRRERRGGGLHFNRRRGHDQPPALEEMHPADAPGAPPPHEMDPNAPPPPMSPYGEAPPEGYLPPPPPPEAYGGMDGQPPLPPPQP